MESTKTTWTRFQSLMGYTDFSESIHLDPECEVTFCGSLEEGQWVTQLQAWARWEIQTLAWWGRSFCCSFGLVKQQLLKTLAGSLKTLLCGENFRLGGMFNQHMQLALQWCLNEGCGWQQKVGWVGVGGCGPYHIPQSTQSKLSQSAGSANEC